MPQFQSWIKLWPQPILNGEIVLRCDIGEFGLLVYLYLVAKTCPVVDVFPPNERIPYEHAEKLISLTEYRPYPKELLAQKFRVTIEWLDQALDKLKQMGEIREDSRGIWIVTWEEHQGDYDRQALYRKGKVQAKRQQNGGWVNAPECPQCLTIEHVELDLELAKLLGKNRVAVCKQCGSVYDTETRKWSLHEKIEPKAKPKPKKKAEQE